MVTIPATPVSFRLIKANISVIVIEVFKSNRPISEPKYDTEACSVPEKDARPEVAALEL